MEATREIEELVGFGGRPAGSDAERRAAEHLAGRLKELGREAETEPVSIYPNWAVTHAIHAALAVVASILSVLLPIAGAALALLVAISTITDISGSAYLLRRLTGRRASQNVVSREDGDKGGTLVLVAHYDSGRGGGIFSRRVQERLATISQTVRTPIGTFPIFFGSILAILVFAVLRLLGLSQLFVSVLQFIPTVILIVSVPMILGVALNEPSPGARDNASGVATVLRLAERFGGQLQHLDLWVLFPGGGEALTAGMREFLKRHEDDLSKEGTIFLNLNSVGAGTVRYATKEGLGFANAYHPQLVELCQEIAEEDQKQDGESRYGARGYVSRLTSDAFPARTRGFPAISISCLNAMDYEPNRYSPEDTADRVEEEALERAFGFCSVLIERIDEQLGPKVAEAGLEEEEE